MATTIPTLHAGQLTMIELRNATLRLDLGKSRHGTLQPQVDVILQRETTHRQMSATLHAFCATLELNTPASERWLVQSERLSEPNHGRIYLELAEGDYAEAMRGMMLLDTLLG